MSNLKLKELLEAGAHFGHQTHKWNPKMKKYVFGERNGIYIVDLAKTIPLAKQAFDFLKKTTSEGRPVLFVATKRQAAETVRNAAEECGAFHVTHRWLGGMLTNYKTINLSVDKLRKVEKMKETGNFGLLTKKERSKVEKDIAKLEKNLNSIKDMRKLPSTLIIVDPNNKRIAIKKANKLGIPVVTITNTNYNPEGINYIIPDNNNTIKSVKLFTQYFADTIKSSNNIKKNTKNKPTRDTSLEKEIISKFEQDIDLINKSTEE